MILGATHPDLVRREGEAYRDGLRQRVADLGLTEHVRFEDRFVTTAELGRWLLAADIFVTPYPGMEQIVSGTLSYAVGAGKAIVSTPYAYAAEVLAEGRGLLVPPSSPVALAEAFRELLDRPELRAGMAERAYAYGRRMVWHRVGASSATSSRRWPTNTGRSPSPRGRRGPSTTGARPRHSPGPSSPSRRSRGPEARRRRAPGQTRFGRLSRPAPGSGGVATRPGGTSRRP